MAQVDKSQWSVCPCGHQNHPGNNNCPKCGVPKAQFQAPQPPVPPQPAPASQSAPTNQGGQQSGGATQAKKSSQEDWTLKPTVSGSDGRYVVSVQVAKNGSMKSVQEVFVGSDGCQVTDFGNAQIKITDTPIAGPFPLPAPVKSNAKGLLVCEVELTHRKMVTITFTLPGKQLSTPAEVRLQGPSWKWPVGANGEKLGFFAALKDYLNYKH